MVDKPVEVKLFKKKEERTKKFYYCICDSNKDREFAFSLFDMLGFKQNIAMKFFRVKMSNEVFENFQEKVPCKIIKNVIRDDNFCVFVPEIQSNMQLYELIEQMDYFCDLMYIPLEVGIEEFLYNSDNCNKKGVIKYNISKFQAAFDIDMNIHLDFDKEYFEATNIEKTLEEWEKTFGDIKFNKYRR